MAFTTTLRVRFGDEDHAQIVYYPRFFHFFHCAFEDLFEESGFPYRDCLDVDQVGWPAVHAEADFLRPVRFGELLTVEITVTKIGARSATFAYEARVAPDEAACRGRVVVACVDMNTFKGRDIPPKYRQLFEGYLIVD